MRGGQEEPDCLQGLQAQEVPHGRHVQVWLQVKHSVKDTGIYALDTYCSYVLT